MAAANYVSLRLRPNRMQFKFRTLQFPQTNNKLLSVELVSVHKFAYSFANTVVMHACACVTWETDLDTDLQRVLSISLLTRRTVRKHSCDACSCMCDLRDWFGYNSRHLVLPLNLSCFTLILALILQTACVHKQCYRKRKLRTGWLYTNDYFVIWTLRLRKLEFLL